MLKPSWIPFIAKNDIDYKLLITMGPGMFSHMPTSSHPGTWPSVVRVSNHYDCHPVSSNGRSYPYWPLLQDWPSLQYNYAPEERRVETVSTSFRLLQTLETNSFFRTKINERQQGWVCIDVWVDGVPLEDSIRLFAGPITEIQRDHLNLSISISAEDMHDGYVPEFPVEEEVMTRGEFPGLPDSYDGVARRMFLVGPNITLLPCVPISEDGLEFYIAEPWLAPAPNRVFVGSNPLADQVPIITHELTAVTNQPYTKLKLRTRPEASGLLGQVFVEGGSGPTTENAISFFLKQIDKLQLTRRAKAAIMELNRDTTQDYSVVSRSRGKVDEILTERLLPQSSLIPFYRGGKFDIIKEGALTAKHNFVLGSNLLFRMDVQPDRSSESSVYNAIDVKFSRKLFEVPQSGVTMRNAIMIDKSFGGTLGKALFLSERKYGRRYLSVEAADLYDRMDARRLGIEIAKISHAVHRRWKYMMPWNKSFMLDINHRGDLTDADLGLSSVPVRVSGLGFTPVGVEVTLQTVDYSGS